MAVSRACAILVFACMLVVLYLFETTDWLPWKAAGHGLG